MLSYTLRVTLSLVSSPKFRDTVSCCGAEGDEIGGRRYREHWRGEWVWKEDVVMVWGGKGEVVDVCGRRYREM